MVKRLIAVLLFPLVVVWDVVEMFWIAAGEWRDEDGDER
jgi:hypothetical protein